MLNFIRWLFDEAIDEFEDVKSYMKMAIMAKDHNMPDLADFYKELAKEEHKHGTRELEKATSMYKKYMETATLSDDAKDMFTQRHIEVEECATKADLWLSKI